MDSKQDRSSDVPAEQASETLLEQAETLIWKLLDDDVQAADVKQLETMLREHEEVRARYIQCVQMHTDLHLHFGDVSETLPTDQLPKSPVLGSLGDLRPGTDTLPLR